MSPRAHTTLSTRAHTRPHAYQKAGFNEDELAAIKEELDEFTSKGVFALFCVSVYVLVCVRTCICVGDCDVLSTFLNHLLLPSFPFFERRLYLWFILC